MTVRMTGVCTGLRIMNQLLGMLFEHLKNKNLLTGIAI
jgi:hypothetical protein